MAAAAPMGKLCNSCSAHRLSKPAQKKLFSSPKFILASSSSPLSTLTLSSPPPPIHATNSPPTGDEFSSTDGLIPQEDLKYLWKLGAGSVAAAALIKYGSILFPQITTPNILFALLIISTPVILSLLILIKKSRSN